MTQGKKKNAELLVVYLLQEGFPIEGQSGLLMGKLDKEKNAEIHWRKPATDHRGLMLGVGPEDIAKACTTKQERCCRFGTCSYDESKSANTYQRPHSPQNPLILVKTKCDRKNQL